MARIRTIKPSFFLNDHLAMLPAMTRLAFPGLWCLADREGRLEDRPTRIKAQIFPYDEVDMDKVLDQLAEAGFIVRYEVEGERLIQVENFAKHQAPHSREAPSTLPAQEKHSLGRAEASPRSRGREGKGREHVHAPDGAGEDEVPFEKGHPPIDPSLIDERQIGQASWTTPPLRSQVPARRRPEPAPKPSDTYTPEFEAWWRAYPGPRKVDKADCFKKWRALLLSGVSVEAIMAGLERWKRCQDWRKDDGQYVCAPLVWLNRRRWDDEPGSAGCPAGSLDGFDALKVIPNEVAGRPWVPSWLQHGGQSTGLASVMNFAKQMGVDPYEAEARFNDGGLPSAGDFVWANRKTG